MRIVSIASQRSVRGSREEGEKKSIEVRIGKKIFFFFSLSIQHLLCQIPVYLASASSLLHRAPLSRYSLHQRQRELSFSRGGGKKKEKKRAIEKQENKSIKRKLLAHRPQYGDSLPYEVGYQDSSGLHLTTYILENRSDSQILVEEISLAFDVAEFFRNSCTYVLLPVSVSKRPDLVSLLSFLYVVQVTRS